ncbi:MAG: MBL fold metallo-hydrolase [Lysinibacillus sp.]
MFKVEKSIDIGRNVDIQFANGKVSLMGTALNVYSYCVDGVLIDTGSASLDKEFQSFFKDIHFEQVMLTHHHEDHTGGAAWIQKDYNVPLFIHEDSVDICAKKGKYPLYRQAVWGKRAPFQATAFGQTFQSRNATWDVIATPGHTTDHLAFYNREIGTMFSGDLYVQSKTKLVLQEENIVETMHSLRKVLTYDFEEVCCCHSGYLPDGRGKLTEKLAYLENLEGEVKHLHTKGLSPKEITKTLFPRQYPISKFSQGEWDASHMIKAFLAQNSS